MIAAMAENYVEVTFTSAGPESHAAAIARMVGIGSVVVVQDHTRERAWHERSRLLATEWASRVVLRVQQGDSEHGPAVRTGDVSHPYRSLQYDGGSLIHVPAKLAELLDELHGELASVRAGRVRFESREYELAVLDAFEAELRTRCEGHARTSFERSEGRTFGRIESRVEFVDDLVHHIRRSGLVDLERLRIEYY
jgi:hypothetical protein